MSYAYKPRAMPSRFLDGAPDIVRQGVIDIMRNPRQSPLDYDVVIRTDVDPDPFRAEIVGLDFGQYGDRGQHFFMNISEFTIYRDRNRRKRVAWRDLPERTQRAIVAYLEE